MSDKTNLENSSGDGVPATAENFETPEEDYNILPRPQTTFQACQMDAEPIVPSLTIGANPLLLEYSDSDKEDDESSSDSDSGQESKTKRPYMYQGNRGPQKETAMDTSLATQSDVSERMVTFQEDRKRKNNVWSQVLTDELQEEAVEQLGFINMDSKRLRIERGPESYGYSRGSTGPSRKRKLNPFLKVDRGPNFQGDSDFSDTGLSDGDLEYIRKNEAIIQKNSEAPKISDGAFPEISKLSSADARAKLYKMGTSKKLGNFMATELLEKKKPIIVRAVEMLGRSYCVRMFMKTLKIERRGGLLVKDGSRRRSPGGVFLHMIRKDTKYSEELKAKVFGPEEEKQSKQRS